MDADDTMLDVVDMPGFARFCGFTPSQQRFFESLAYARYTPEAGARFRTEFKRDCRIRPVRGGGPREWVVAYLGPATGPEGYGRLRTISGNGGRIIFVTASPDASDEDLLALASD